MDGIQDSIAWLDGKRRSLERMPNARTTDFRKKWFAAIWGCGSVEGEIMEIKLIDKHVDDALG